MVDAPFGVAGDTARNFLRVCLSHTSSAWAGECDARIHVAPLKLRHFAKSVINERRGEHTELSPCGGQPVTRSITKVGRLRGGAQPKRYVASAEYVEGISFYPGAWSQAPTVIGCASRVLGSRTEKS